MHRNIDSLDSLHHSDTYYREPNYQPTRNLTELSSPIPLCSQEFPHKPITPSSLPLLRNQNPFPFHSLLPPLLPRQRTGQNFPTPLTLSQPLLIRLLAPLTYPFLNLILNLRHQVPGFGHGFRHRIVGPVGLLYWVSRLEGRWRSRCVIWWWRCAW